MKANIGEMLVADMAERPDDAVQERLAADEAMIREQIGAVGEMLAGTEADLEMQGTLGSEQADGIDRPLLGQADRRQQLFDQGGLPLAELMTGSPAVETSDGGDRKGTRLNSSH